MTAGAPKPSPGLSAQKIHAARWSVLTASGLALLKLAAGLSTGSMAVIASGVDSLLDILMSALNYAAIRQADRPADECHPFGHGKFEAVATLAQALIIASSGAWIVFESVRRLLAGTTPGRLEGGVAVLLLSTAVSWWIARRLRRAAAATDSSVLEADALHFAMDVYTNLALVAGLVLVAWLDWFWLDPVLSLAVALFILREALALVRRGLGEVLDEELPEPVRREVAQLVEAHQEHLVDIHRLRTRRAGSQKIMDFHLTVCKHLSVEEAHAIADHLERRIKEEIPGADVIIHIEPCLKEECPGAADCPTEKARWPEDRRPGPGEGNPEGTGS